MSICVCDNSLVFKAGKGKLFQICLDDILFFEHRHRKVIIHTLNKQYKLPNISLTKVEQTLDSHGFVRTHRAYVVHIKKVYKMVGGREKSAQLFINNTDTVAYLSKNYRPQFPLLAVFDETASSKE